MVVGLRRASLVLTRSQTLHVRSASYFAASRPSVEISRDVLILTPMAKSGMLDSMSASVRERATGAAATTTARASYDADFFVRTQHTAVLLRSGRFGQLDVHHLAEEIEDMGKRDLVELKSRLRVLLAHLLKWRFQRAKRTRSWEATILTQRQDIAALIEEAPACGPGSKVR
jgi:ribosomal protein L29